MSRYADDELITWPQAKAAAVRIRELLADRGWSQLRLSRESGVNPASINHAVQGCVRMLIANAEKVAAALGTDLDDLTQAAEGTGAPRRAEIPSRAVLMANCDQKLAMTRDVRADLAASGEAGEHVLALADTMAATLRAEFPCLPELGRVVMAVVIGIDSLRAACDMNGTPWGAFELTAVTGLAAEALEHKGGA